MSEQAKDIEATRSAPGNNAGGRSAPEEVVETGDRPAATSPQGKKNKEKSAAEGPAPTLRTYALAAVAERALGAIGAKNDQPERQFLRAHYAAVNPEQNGWNNHLAAYLERPAAEDVPLVELIRAFDLSVGEGLAVALARAVEDDPMVGRVMAFLQAPVGGSRPTLGLLSSTLGQTMTSRRPVDAFLTGAAIQSGLLTLLGDGAPLPERPVKVPIHLHLALRDRDGVVPGTQIGLGRVPRVPLPPSIQAEAERQAAALRASADRALVIRSRSIGEGRSVAELLAHALGRRPLFIEGDLVDGITPWLFLRRLLPVFCYDLGPGERQSLPALPYYAGPVLALCGPDGSVEAPGGASPSWTIPIPSQAEREKLWQIALGNDELAATLTRHHRHGCGRIAHLGRLAQHQSLLQQRERPEAADVLAASWVGEGGGLESLAQPLPDGIPDEALVMTRSLRSDLEALLSRCLARDGLVDGLGVSAVARYRPGVRSLFVGPSGTGKTLAAGWLATKLNLPLYRVDMASVTSKYIGETEKNLAQLLARAEEAEVVLLFDEADALFGKRTDVQQANDRFANAQTNYLLQRIETYDGVTILTSNSRSRFDEAFTRRLDMILEFPLPGPRERRALWLAHLGTYHDLSPAQLNRLAGTADLAGGHIRNAVLAAAVSAQEKGGPIGMADILVGLEIEYRKLNRQVPAELLLNSGR